MPRTGRPKTGAGHRDDAMLDMLEFRQKLTAHAEDDPAHHWHVEDRMAV